MTCAKYLCTFISHVTIFKVRISRRKIFYALSSIPKLAAEFINETLLFISRIHSLLVAVFLQYCLSRNVPGFGRIVSRQYPGGNTNLFDHKLVGICSQLFQLRYLYIFK